MKKLSIILLMMLSIVFASFSFIACDDGGDPPPSEDPTPDVPTPDDPTPEPTPDEPTYEPMAFDTNTVFVFSQYEAHNTKIAKAYADISGGFKTAYGIEPPKETDASQTEQEFEILIGNTSRPQSAKALEELQKYDTTGAHAFIAAIIDGKLTITGTSISATEIACKWISETYLIGENYGIPKELFEVRFFTKQDYKDNDREAKPLTSAEYNAINYIESIKVGSSSLVSFSPDKLSYTIKLNRGDAFPKITVGGIGNQNITITEATSQTNATTIKVLSADGTSHKTYTINFEISPVNYPTATIQKAKDGADAIVVIVHDDGDTTTGTFLKKEFIKYDLCGTIAMITNKVCAVDSQGNRTINQSTVNFWQDLLDTGRFSMSSHTRTHTYWGRTDAGDSGQYYPVIGNDNTASYNYAPGQITREVAGSQEDLRACFPTQRVLTFVKAGFGKNVDGSAQISDEAFSIIKRYYITMRNTGGGVDTIPAADPYNVKSHMVKAGQTASEWTGYVDQAIAQKGMIVFLFHNIRAAASGNTVAEADASTLFKHISDKKTAGKVWCATFEEASLYTEEYRTASVSATQTDAGITVSLTDKVDNTIYNHALTVKIQIVEPDWNKVLRTNVDGTTETLTVQRDSKGAYVMVDIVPDSGNVILTKCAD